MDWLSRHYATVDCYRKEVRFCRPEETEVVFYGLRKILSNSIMTTMKVSKMSRPDPRSNPNGRSEPSLGRMTI